MKKYFSNRVALAILFFVIGGLTDLTFNKLIDKKRSRQMIGQINGEQSKLFFDKLYGPDFFGQSKDPFAEMRRMQTQLLNPFYSDDQFKNSFDFWYENRFGGLVTDIKQSEDQDYIYYDIALAETPKSLKVEVKDGQVFVYEEEENHISDQKSEKSFSSSFLRSFPVPAGVDPEKHSIEKFEKSMRIKFPKLKS